MQTLLHRMLQKRLVERERRGRNQVYRAAIDRDAAISAELDRVASRFCDGSRSPLLQGLLDTSDLTAADMRQLRQVLDAAKRRRGR